VRMAHGGWGRGWEAVGGSMTHRPVTHAGIGDKDGIHC